MSRPCSIHVYQVTLNPQIWATSSRRNPGVRRRCPLPKPCAAGDWRSLRARRKALSDCAGTLPECGFMVSYILA